MTLLPLPHVAVQPPMRTLARMLEYADYQFHHPPLPSSSLSPCSDVMSKQMKAIRNGRQSQQLRRPPPTTPGAAAFGKQTKLSGNKQKFAPLQAQVQAGYTSPSPCLSYSWRGIKNYLQQLPSSSTLLKRDSSRQQQQWQQRQRWLQRGVDFSIRLSAALIFRGKAADTRRNCGPGTLSLGSMKIQM